MVRTEKKEKIISGRHFYYFKIIDSTIAFFEMRRIKFKITIHNVSSEMGMTNRLDVKVKRTII